MTKKLRADLVLLFVALFWGASFSLMRNVTDYLPPIGYLAIRFILAAVALLLIFHRRLKSIDKMTLLSGTIIGVFLFLGMGLQVLGIAQTTATNSAFITGLNFVFVPLISAFLLKKRPGKIVLVGVAVAFGGLLLLSGGLTLSFNFGDFLTLLCAICFAMQIIVIDRYTERHDPVLLGVVQITVAAVLFILAWLVFDRQPMPMLNTPFVWFVLLWTGLGGTAFCFAAQTVVQKNTTPTHTAVILTMEPVFGALFALFIPDTDGTVETMTVLKAVGCLLIFAGMLLSEFGLPFMKKKQ